MERFDNYLMVGEAAEFLGVTRNTLRNWEKSRKLIPYRHPMNAYRMYKREDLLLLLKSTEPFREDQIDNQGKAVASIRKSRVR
jgi:MerR family copper efflux transcriptional regulator